MVTVIWFGIFGLLAYEDWLFQTINRVSANIADKVDEFYRLGEIYCRRSSLRASNRKNSTLPNQPSVLTEPSSFRDPSGVVFYRDGLVMRQVNQSYKSNYRKLMDSGLYETLTDQGLLIPHREIDLSNAIGAEAYRVIQPDLLPIVTYSYEWCFGQLREVALTTLRIQRIALEHGMTLKDASAYNFQFVGASTPLMIDTLSFETYEEGRPWVA